MPGPLPRETMELRPVRQRFQDELLSQLLRSSFGEAEPEVLDQLRQRLQWCEAAGGETLMRQGEPGDSMYLVVSGRLRAYIREDDGRERMISEMARGQIVGEMSLYTDEPRAATVVAIRDSVLVRLDKAAFRELLSRSAQAGIALTRRIIQRLHEDRTRVPPQRPVMIGLLPVTDGIDTAALGAELAAQLARIGRVRVIDAAAVDQALHEAGLAQSGSQDAERDRRIALWLDEVEAAHDFVLLLADDGPTAWTRRCSRHCDELLLLADATRPPALHPTETALLMDQPRRTEAAEILVLLHPADTRCPRGTRGWLARRPVAGHVHLRPALERDMARLARLASRTAVGLVLAGGGARGFAHLGVYRALQAHGVEIDWVGGTSIGAVMATYVASDQPFEAIMDNVRRAFRVNPTGDYQWLPLLSLIKGRRLRGVLTRAVQELVGFDAEVEDLWKNFFCVATNYTRASEQLIQQGRLASALLASTSIPGALPPVIHDGDLLCDGGTFNNFPVDAMRTMPGVGRVIGVDLGPGAPQPLAETELPGTLALLRDRLRPAAERRYPLPTLPSYLMSVTTLYSASRQRVAQKLCDLYFKPPLDRVGMLQWHKLDAIAQQAEAHAESVLGALSPEERARLGVAASTGPSEL